MPKTYFQQTSVLSDENYKKLMLDKDNVYFKGTGTVTINQDGSIVKKEYDRAKATDSSKEAIVNFTFDIEKFRILYPDSFINAIYGIENKLKENGLVNPKCASSVMYRNNLTTPWHKHGIIPGVKPAKFWIVIYYMHPNWDPANGGQLAVGLLPEQNVGLYDCFSNSFVAHNGYFGHGVDQLKLGYSGDRDILLTHWITE